MVTEKFRISDMERVDFQGKPAVAGDLRFPIIRSCQFTMMLLDECYHLVATVVDEYLSDYTTRESVNYLCASGPAGHFSPHFFCPLDDDKLCGDATWVAVTYLPYTADCCRLGTSLAFNLSRMPVELRQHYDSHLYRPPYSQFADGRTLYYRLKLPDKCWRDEDGDVILIDECVIRKISRQISTSTTTGATSASFMSRLTPSARPAATSASPATQIHPTRPAPRRPGLGGWIMTRTRTVSNTTVQPPQLNVTAPHPCRWISCKGITTGPVTRR